MVIFALTRLLVSGLTLGAVFFFHAPPGEVCVDAQNRPLCYTQALEKKLSEEGVGAALELVANIYNRDPSFINYCHGNLHDIGVRAYEIYYDTGKVEITPRASYCGFGFYHGFMEEMLAERGTLAESRDFCRKVGEEMSGTQAYAEGACYHGIGHGVTDGTNVEVWGDAMAIIRPGLTLCREIADTDEWLMRCSSGVFNSLALLYRDSKYKLGTPSDPYALCDTSEFLEPEKRSCYAQMNTLVMFLAQHDPEKSLAYTRSIKDANLRHIAIMNVSAMPFQWKKIGEQGSIPICRALGPDGPHCIRGVVSGMMEFGIPGKEADRALELCLDPRLGKEERMECMNEIIVMSLGMFSPQQLADVCKRIPDEYAPSQCS